MPTTDFGLPVVNGYVRTSHGAYSDGVPLPQGRAMANGNRSVMITGIASSVGGWGGARVVTMHLGNASTGQFTVPQVNGQPGSTGFHSTNGWIVNGGTTRFTVRSVHATSQITLERGSGGTTISEYNGASYSGRIPGSIRYAEAPTAPTGLAVSNHPTAVGAVNLTWNLPASDGGHGITGYTIFRNGTQIAAVTSANRSFTDYRATPGTSYTYQVAASNAVTNAAGSTSVLSGGATITVRGGIPPTPLNLTATTEWAARDNVRLQWTLGAFNSSEGQLINVYRDGNLIAPGISGLSYLDRAPHKPGGYKYTIAATTAWARTQGLESARTTAVTGVPSTAVGAPRSLTATPHSTNAGQVVLNWLRPTIDLGLTQYRIYVGGEAAATITASGATGTYTATVTPGLSYTFRVVGINPLGEGTSSASVTATATGDPAAPTNLVATGDGLGVIRLDWVAPSGAITGYTLYDATTSQIIGFPAAGATSYWIGGMVPGTARSFYLRARTQYTDEGGSVGGKPSNTARGTAGDTETQSPLAAYSGVSNISASAYGGTKTITATTASTFSFLNAAGSAFPETPAAFTVTNNTNTALSGTKTITSVGVPGSSRTFSYAQTTPNLPPNTASGGSTLNNTNVTLSGTYTVTGANPVAGTFTYAKTTPDLPAREAAGTATNKSNQIFNISSARVIATTERTVAYARNAADAAPAAGGGIITNVTARDHINGTYAINAPRTHDSLEFTRTSAPNLPAANKSIDNASFENWGSSMDAPVGWTTSAPLYSSREMQIVRRGASALRLSAPSAGISTTMSGTGVMSYAEHGNRRMFMFELDVHVAAGSASGLVASLMWNGLVQRDVAIGPYIQQTGQWYRIRGWFDRGATAGTVTSYVPRLSLNANTAIAPASAGDVVVDYYNIRQASANEEAAILAGAILQVHATPLGDHDDQRPIGDASGVKVADSKGTLEVVYRPGWTA